MQTQHLPLKQNAIRLRIVLKPLLVLVLFVCSYAWVQAQCNQLVWSDEFNTPGAPDPAKWGYETGTGAGGWGNGEAQYYTNRSQNSRVEGGVLKVIALKEDYLGSQYTSARLLTKGKFDFKYGRIETRAKFPTGVGTWPAIWMLGSNIDQVSWPACGEIDIVEHLGRDLNRIFGTLHYPGRSGGNANGGSIVEPTATTAFHTYAVEWSPAIIKFFVDNTLYHSVPNNSTIPFNHNFFFIINMAMGGNFGGPAIDPAFTSATLEVDYLRVYRGSYNYGVAGDAKVYTNETGKVYSIESIPGATYTWTVPAGATITSGQGTNSIVVNWGATGGNISVTTAVGSCAVGAPTNTYQLAVTTEALLPVERVYEDFQTNRVVTYLPKTTGTLTQAIANPSTTGVNTSPLVGRYIRKSTELYDVLYIQNLTVTNANDFVSGRKRLSMDIYTSAPVGSKISMQLENSAAVTTTNYPTGRHSAYKAYTTVQNRWETVEFELEAVLDAGTSIFSVDNVVFLFESGSNSGNTYFFDNLLVRAAPESPVLATDILENYNGTSRIAKGTSTGTYTANVANPAPNAVNGSTTVASYVRNASELYDVLFFSAGTTIEDAGQFKNQTKKILVDVYTTAPIGTLVSLNLENNPLSQPANYPTGRNSSYQAITTRQNQWETLTFYYASSPDAGTSNLIINQMVFLFSSGSNTSHTYYIDNIRIASTKLPDTYTTGTTYENYNGTRAITYVAQAGVNYTADVANPSVSGINTSTQVGRYIRNTAALYDNLQFATTLTDAGDFKRETKKFAMDLYTTAPVGTVISWQLESSPASSGNYPTGRHSIYQAVVKQTNAWHTLIFTYSSTPDASVADASVNRFVLLFNPGSSTGHTYYVDNLRSLNVVPANTSSLPAPWQRQDIGAVGAAGNASFVSGAFTVQGAGADIWGTADGFQYVYRTLTGDGEIIARVNSLTNTNTYAKAGVMFRETLTAGSKHAMTNVTPTAGAEFLSRNATGGTTVAAVTAGVAAPRWVRLVRNGNVFTSFQSANGTTWTQIGCPVTIAMTSTVYVGMAVTSHVVGTLTTSVFDNVTVQNVTAPATNLALNKPTTASSLENATFGANLATDGNGGTRWSSSFANATEWIYVDLGATYAVNRVKLVWEGAYATQYQVQVSSDLNWTGKTVFTVTAGDGATDDLTLSGTGRYVRILCTQKALAPYGYSLWDFEVYGTATGARIGNESLSNAEAEILLYPNPSGSYLNVTLPGDLKASQLVIHDLTGRVLWQKELSRSVGDEGIDIRNLKPGLYILSIRSQGRSVNKRFIKQ
jgi:beta-glucanase (GH16 family)